MKIAVLSGKGGTGKTFVAVNLAAVFPSSVYMDCDVEEPNGHLFFKPDHIIKQTVSVKTPVVQHEKCNGCRVCEQFCRFNALAYISEKVMVFDDICHSCGGCVLLCPQQAISEMEKPIGVIEKGTSNQVKVVTGFLNPGQASGVPIIKQIVEEKADDAPLTVIDCPPGSACVVMESIKQADYCVLVAEPTIFGTHNLNMVYELVKLFHKPFGVVLNKCLDGENPAEEFCSKNNIHILAKIPYDKELATINSNGLLAVSQIQSYADLFEKLLGEIAKEVQGETAFNS